MFSLDRIVMVVVWLYGWMVVVLVAIRIEGVRRHRRRVSSVEPRCDHVNEQHATSDERRSLIAPYSKIGLWYLERGCQNEGCKSCSATIIVQAYCPRCIQ